MFEADELSPCMDAEWFVSGYSELQRKILDERLGKPYLNSDQVLAKRNLLRFSQAVLASAPAWIDSKSGLERALCVAAGDIEAGFGIQSANTSDSVAQGRHFLKAALLYDMAGLPGASAKVARDSAFDNRVQDFFLRRRESFWGSLKDASASPSVQDEILIPEVEVPGDINRLVHTAIAEALFQQGENLQFGKEKSDQVHSVFRELSNQAGSYRLDLAGDDFIAISKVLDQRREYSSLAILEKYSGLDRSQINALGVPLEFWPVQKQAIEEGLLAENIISYGLAAPTGTGKTSLAKVLIASAIKSQPNKKVVYISPSRALVHQVSRDLADSLGRVGIKVRELGAHLTVHEQLSTSDESEVQVLVFTPERADLLLRVDQEFVKNIALVLVDEAHHIEQGSRGILLEFYLWRIRQLVSTDARVIQLSAVAPNISDLVSWLSVGENSSSVKVDWRTNRLRLGRFEFISGEGVLKFEGVEPTPLAVTECDDRLSRLARLAMNLSTSGIVLVLCTTVRLCEDLAERIFQMRSKLVNYSEYDGGEDIERLDAKIERELYPESSLRNHIKRKVAYHHAQLPPSVRISLEDIISAKKIDIVCATTTLAEGVNFPFATVLVESLVSKNYQITPRSLWNIAGRAGRFGVDSEGHCILFEPQSYEHKLQGFTLQNYLGTTLDSIPPVQSALGAALTELKEAIESGKIQESILESVKLGNIKIDGKNTALAKRIRGLVNLVRVSYTHASVAGLVKLNSDNATEISTSMLASNQMSLDVKVFADTFSLQQKKVIQTAFSSDAELMNIAARIGWSLEAQAELHEWLMSLDDWRLEKFGQIVVGGHIYKFDALSYLLGPVSKFMSEFEGDKLGGVTSFVSCIWVEGQPLTSIRDRQQNKNLGELVRMIYSKVQYLLPWALYGVAELLSYEAKRRRIKVQGGVRDLSVLAAEGVPNFNALQLVMGLGLERVDATRIAAAYGAPNTGKRQTTDVVGFFRGLEAKDLFRIVRGNDRRRIDPDIYGIWQKINGKT
ncbi:DEAD/DEAH box helicase [Pseudomonas fitomaticsae]|uniref:DEAD/DEAH box helicase n=1 Tax=Pseudomonas fitomaticsae TaxID=2837969 RepID=A0ABY3Q0X0_9PSED|nr:DEAD/DEAH box helicase [Pseudomonas fitomaticsae]UFP99736.1 DEAD/DEAH box helicase [Pseudomonas fitomaticsae]